MFAAMALLTLAQSVGYALSHSPTVVKQAAVVAQARSEYVRQHSLELPNVTGSIANQLSKSANYQGAYSVIGASQAAVFSQNTAQIGSRYTFNGGLSHYQTLIAKQSYEQSRADLRKVQNQVTTDVTSAYYALSSKVEAVRLDAFDLQYQTCWWTSPKPRSARVLRPAWTF